MKEPGPGSDEPGAATHLLSETVLVKKVLVDLNAVLDLQDVVLLVFEQSQSVPENDLETPQTT